MKIPPTLAAHDPDTAARTQLLISVRDVDEAEKCLAAGVDWIDLKNPSAGSLGCPSLEVAVQVAQRLGQFPKRSVALGELANLNWRLAIALSELFPIVKVGLSNMLEVADWAVQLRRLSYQISQSGLASQLVPVIYADWQSCSAPRPDHILHCAIDLRSPFLLVDTFHKNGKRLLDHLDTDSLAQLNSQAQAAEVGIVLAGSLTANDLPHLLPLGCAAIAIRGAVCDHSRLGNLNASLVRQWVQTVHHCIS